MKITIKETTLYDAFHHPHFFYFMYNYIIADYTVTSLQMGANDLTTFVIGQVFGKADSGFQRLTLS